MKIFNAAAPHGHALLVKIAEPEPVLEETHALTAEAQKYTLAQVEALEVAPGAAARIWKAGFPRWLPKMICARPWKKPSTIAAT